MRKLVSAVMCIALLATTVTGCGKEEKDVEVKKTNTPLQQLDCLFPRLDNTWVGDVMAQADEEGIHLNYLYETDNNGVGYHPIYRFDTKDFCSYNSMGEIIPFATEVEQPDIAVGTGSFIKAQDGTYHCFYTGHNDYTDTFEGDVDRECLMHATSSDNLNYEKQPEDTIRVPEGYSSTDFRDPQVFYNEETENYWMLVGALPLTKSGSSILKYTSDDLSSWDFEGEFYHSDELYFMECPDVFRINDWYYMVFSWNNVTYYRMAKSLEGEWIKPEIDTFDGNGFYAAKTVEYEGIRYLVGFLDRKKRGSDRLEYTWAGSLMPYELVQHEDGTLGATLPHQFVSYFTENAKPFVENENLKSDTDMGTLPDKMLVEATVNFSKEDGAVSFRFGACEENPEGYNVTLDCGKDIITYDAYENTQPVKLEANRDYDIRIVVENETIVFYIAEDKVFSNRIYSAVGNNWQLVFGDECAEVSKLKAYSK